MIGECILQTLEAQKDEKTCPKLKKDGMKLKSIRTALTWS